MERVTFVRDLQWLWFPILVSLPWVSLTISLSIHDEDSTVNFLELNGTGSVRNCAIGVFDGRSREHLPDRALDEFVLVILLVVSDICVC